MQRNSEDNSGENKGIETMEQNLEDFRRDIYQRYGEKIAEKQQKAYYSKETGSNWNCDGKKTGAENNLADKNMMERENVTVRGNRTEERNILEINDTREENRILSKGNKTERGKIIKEKNISERPGINEMRTSDKKEKMSFVSLTLGIFSVIGLILLFFL